MQSSRVLRGRLLACALLTALSGTAAGTQTCAFPGFTRAPISAATGATDAVQNIAVGGSPVFVLLYDFNKDGKMDLATADLGSDTITVELGNGDGTFSPAPGSPIAMPPSSQTNGSRPDGLAAADFDGDGKPDIVGAMRNTQQLQFLHGNGDGSFTLGSTIQAGSGGSAPDHIVVGDFNGDGKLDVAISLQGLYASGGVAVMLGDGAGHFSHAPGSPMVIPGNGVTGIVAGHFTGHAPLDLAYTVGGLRTVVIARGAGDGSFTTVQSINTELAGTHAYPVELSAADVNGDGRMDLVVADFEPRSNGAQPPGPGNDVAVLLQKADGTFDTPVHVAAGTDVISVATADFNSDGHPDFVAANAAWGFSGTVRLGDGSADFGGTANASYSAGGNPYHVAIADLNNDGSPDFVIVNQPSNTLSAYLYNCVPSNHAPVANPDGGDGFVTDKNTAFKTLSLLGNDTDADGDPLSVSSIDTAGTLGTVTYMGDGSVRYDPNGQFAQLGVLDSTIDTFRYTVTDGHGLSSTTTVTITVYGALPADLRPGVSDLPSPLVAGTEFTLGIGAYNDSQYGANNVVVTATLSANLAVADPGNCSVPDSHTLVCPFGAIPAFNNAGRGVQLRVLSGGTGNAQVTAVVSGDEPDPAAGNNTMSVTAPISLLADARISVDDGAGTIVAGATPTYTVTVNNAGPSDIAQAAVLFAPQPGLLNTHWTCVGDSGGTCPASGSGTLDDNVYLPAGAQLTYTIQGTLDPAYSSGTFGVVATVVSAVDDPSTGDESAGDSDNVTIQGDASVGVDLAASYAVINHLSRYTVVAGNSGPSQLSGVQIGSALPVGLTAVTWSCTVSGGASCGGSGNGALADTMTLPPGSSVRYTVTGIVASTQDYLNVNATLTAPAGQDTQPANDAASSAVPVSVFRSGFEPGEATRPAVIDAPAGASGAMALGTPELVPTVLAQWHRDGAPCAYVIGVRRAGGAEYALLQADANGTWQASPWYRAAAAVQANWSSAAEGIGLLLVDGSGSALATR